jgi:hypothetical protein
MTSGQLDLGANLTRNPIVSDLSDVCIAAERHKHFQLTNDYHPLSREERAGGQNGFKLRSLAR